MSHLRYVHPTNLEYDIQRGIYPGKSLVSIFGYNDDVDALPEDLIPWGGTYVFQAAAVAMEIISSSASDDGAPVGTGARTVTVSGLNGSFVPISETVIMNGVTAVPLVNSYRRINAVEVSTVGSVGVNVGNVDVRVVAGAVIQARIVAGDGISRTAIYTVPATKAAYIVSSNAAVKRVTAETVDVMILSRNLAIADQSQKIRGYSVVHAQGTSAIQVPAPFDRLVGPSDLWARAQLASGNNNGVTARVNLILEDA